MADDTHRYEYCFVVVVVVVVVSLVVMVVVVWMDKTFPDENPKNMIFWSGKQSIVKT